VLLVVSTVQLPGSSVPYSHALAFNAVPLTLNRNQYQLLLEKEKAVLANAEGSPPFSTSDILTYCEEPVSLSAAV